MARYDRIAPLAAPSRGRVFSAWTALRDLEIGERNSDLGQRARVRFLALRPVHRLLARGIDSIPAESYERQIEGVREELGHLSARDPERAQLAHFLHAICQRSPQALVAATLEMGENIEAAGHYFGAEEYYLTGLEVAETYDLVSRQVTALRFLGRVCRKGARWHAAESYYKRAIDLADRTADRRQWARAMDGKALIYGYRGNYPKARTIFEEVLQRGEEWRDDYVRATAYSSLCYNALAANDQLEQALEYGWTAIQLFEHEEERHPVLGNLGTAFLRLGAYDAAERCCEIIISRTTKVAFRVQARADHALVAAEAGRADAFRERVDGLLRDLPDWGAEPWLCSRLYLDFGRGCFLLGDTDSAREYLRQAIGTAEDNGYNEILVRAEELLTALEQAALTAAAPRLESAAPLGAAAERIAGEVQSYEEQLLAAT